MINKHLKNFKLQYITSASPRYDEIESANLALQGGCRWIQLRMKKASKSEVLKFAIKLKELCSKFDATFIVNDDPQIALDSDADGVHLGYDDMPVFDARQILGEEKIIGSTCNTFSDICFAKEQGANYVGLGPYRQTITKDNLSPLLGLSGYQWILSYLFERKIKIPVVAIGGIEFFDVGYLLDMGVTGIGVSGGILNADNVIKRTESFLARINIYDANYR